MEPTDRDELLRLLRDLGAQLAWQRDAGLGEVPRGVDAAPSSSVEPTVEALPPSQHLPPPETTVAASPVVEPPASVVPEARPRPREGVPTRAEAPAVVAPTPVAPPRSLPVLVPPPPRDLETRRGRLEVVAADVRACEACKLALKRTQTVFARGNPDARLCFIGEGPGADEDRLGEPFVGAAGQLLDKIIAAMRLGVDDVYIANIVKCRPPNNRVPDAEEMRACTPFLLRQLDEVKPAVIVALGKTAASFLLDSKAPMGQLRGRWHTWNGVPVMPTWHPSYVLRVRDNPNSTARAEVWNDMKLVLVRLGLPVPGARG